jgi:hypothetical protein
VRTIASCVQETCLISKHGTRAHSNGFTECFYTVALALNHPCLTSSYINPLRGNVPKHALLYYFTLSNARLFYLSWGECYQPYQTDRYVADICHSSVKYLQNICMKVSVTYLQHIGIWPNNISVTVM